jgi:two-component system, NtrC family, response regulator HydG
MSRSLLVVDDDPRIRASVAQALSAADMDVRAADSAEQALALIGEQRPDVVLTDVRMPGLDGLSLLRLLRERAPDVDVLLMTAFDDLPTVTAAMRDGAVDFLVKPLDLHLLRRKLGGLFDDRQPRRNASAGTHGAPTNGGARGVAVAGAANASGPPMLVGRDPRLIEIFKTIGQIAASRVSVLIRGESGTGKELVAQAVHASSPFAGEPFVAVNCASLPSTLLESELFGHVKGAFTGAAGDHRGRFALAGRGTIFLDEIGDTSPEFQSKLLRVLQQHEFYPVGAERPLHTEARVIAATHRDLERMVSTGQFRQDLYYRLRVVEIALPALRERMGDFPALAEHLIGRAAASAGRQPPAIAPEAMEALLRHGWPGNVRELENCLTRAVLIATGPVIHPEHLALDGESVDGATGLAPLQEVERRHVARVLAAVGWQKTRAAELLGVSRPRLDRLIERHGLIPSS